jgi:uncharacterized protein YndB with AHSA1/START domain
MKKRVSFTLEFLFRASPTILYRFVTTPNCLVRWFCDKVDNVGDQYSFFWGNNPEDALLIDDIEDERVRYSWESEDEDEYFEFRFSKSEVTSETILELTDFCDEDDVESQKRVWTTQLEALRRAVGG